MGGRLLVRFASLIPCLAIPVLTGQGALAGGAAWVDPTRPPAALRSNGGAADAESGQKLELQSILVGDSRRLALIGGQAFAIGDRIGSLTVQNIYRDRVVLQGKGGTRILRLTLSSGMKKAPSP